MDGGDGGWPVLYGSDPVPASSGTIDLVIDEDQIGDSERKHTTEQVAYLVIDPPLADATSSAQVAIPGIDDIRLAALDSGRESNSRSDPAAQAEDDSRLHNGATMISIVKASRDSFLELRILDVRERFFADLDGSADELTSDLGIEEILHDALLQ